jgi:hypothetical protein
LVDRIVRASAAGRLPGRVVVVLEGTGASGVSEGEIHAGSRTSVHVVHAAGSGDDQLVDLATAAGPTGVGVVVVTAIGSYGRGSQPSGAVPSDRAGSTTASATRRRPS